MPARPEVSVLIPTRNRAALLESTLFEIAAETYRGGGEILVSDNASTDATADVLRDFPAECLSARGWELRWWHQETNIGIVGNFNALMDAAAGRLVAFHLDDDRWDPDYLEVARQRLEEQPGCKAVVIANRTHDDQGNVGSGWLEAHRHPLTSPPPAEGRCGAGAILGAFASRPAFNLSQLVFRSTLLRAESADGPHFDAVFFLELLKEGDVWIERTPRCSFRITPEAYGRSDVLGTQSSDNLLYSHALANALARMAGSGAVRRGALVDLAARRAMKSLIHFAKSCTSSRPDPAFLALFARLAGGIAFGWRQRRLERFSSK